MQRSPAGPVATGVTGSSILPPPADNTTVFGEYKAIHEPECPIVIFRRANFEFPFYYDDNFFQGDKFFQCPKK